MEGCCNGTECGIYYLPGCTPIFFIRIGRPQAFLSGASCKPSIQRGRLNEAKSIEPRIVPWKLHVGQTNYPLSIATIPVTRGAATIDTQYARLTYQGVEQMPLQFGKKRAKKGISPPPKGRSGI
jgi:hypothetical protein